MKKIVILTALALGAAGSLAFAGTAAAHRGAQGAMLERLKAADTNADGLISRTEAAALPRLAGRFERIDANQDGQVSFDELRASRHRGHGPTRSRRGRADAWTLRLSADHDRTHVAVRRDDGVRRRV